jgi:hypothetical protein
METIERIEIIVNESIEQGKDLFAEYYGFRDDALY